MLSFFLRDVLDEIWDLIEAIPEGFPNYSFQLALKMFNLFSLPSKEPWTQKPPKIFLDLHKNKKSEVDSHSFKADFF